MANFSFERRKEENAMEWNGSKEKRGQNNSSNIIRKFILKAHSVSFLLSVRFFPSIRSNVVSAVGNTRQRLGRKRSFSYEIKIICALAGVGKINSTCFVRHNSSREFKFFPPLLLFVVFFLHPLSLDSLLHVIFFFRTKFVYRTLITSLVPFCFFSNGTKKHLE